MIFFFRSSSENWKNYLESREGRADNWEETRWNRADTRDKTTVHKEVDEGGRAMKTVTRSADRVCAWRLITRCSFWIGLLTFHSSRDARWIARRIESWKIEAKQRIIYHVGIKIKIILCTGYDILCRYETDESCGLIRTRGYVKMIDSRPGRFVTIWEQWRVYSNRDCSRL